LAGGGLLGGGDGGRKAVELPAQRSRFRGEMRLNLFRMATGDKIIDQLSLPPSAVKALAEAEAQRPKKR
jgi:hypothetical protein